MRKKPPQIKESVEDLHQLVKREKDVQKRQRVQALYLLKSGQARSRLEVAAMVAVHRHTVGAWLERYEQGGLAELLTVNKPPGQAPSVTGAALQALKKRLAQRDGFASYREIQTYLEREHQIKLRYSSVHALVRYRLGAKPKSPRPSHQKKA
jgi:transposase